MLNLTCSPRLHLGSQWPPFLSHARNVRHLRESHENQANCPQIYQPARKSSGDAMCVNHVRDDYALYNEQQEGIISKLLVAFDLDLIAVDKGLSLKQAVSVDYADSERGLNEHERNQKCHDDLPSLSRDIQAVSESTDAIISNSIDVNKLNFIGLLAHVVSVLVMIYHVLKLPRCDANCWETINVRNDPIQSLVCGQ